MDWCNKKKKRVKNVRSYSSIKNDVVFDMEAIFYINLLAPASDYNMFRQFNYKREVKMIFLLLPFSSLVLVFVVNELLNLFLRRNTSKIRKEMIAKWFSLVAFKTIFSLHERRAFSTLFSFYLIIILSTCNLQIVLMCLLKDSTGLGNDGYRSFKHKLL